MKDGSLEWDTDWFNDVYLKYEKLPMGRYGHPDDIAGAVYFFCSEDSKYVTGRINWLMEVFQLLFKMKITNLCIVFIFSFKFQIMFILMRLKFIIVILTSTNIKYQMSAPTEIKIVYNSKTNNLIDYIWNKISVVDDFELISNNFNLEFIEIGRKGYKKTLSDEDIRNGLYFNI